MSLNRCSNCLASYDGWGHICPACQRTEAINEQQAKDAENLREHLGEIEKANIEVQVHLAEKARESTERAAYLSNNPGDYECPACRMISLRYRASRCPKCQSDVSGHFWEDIREAEKAEEERKKQEEQKRQAWLASPEYAEQLRVEAEKLRIERERKERATEAENADKARREAEAMLAQRKAKIEKKLWFVVLLIGIIGSRVGLYLAGMTGFSVGGVAGLILGWYVRRIICEAIV